MRHRTLLVTGFLIGGAVSAGEVVRNGDFEDGWEQTAWEFEDSQGSITLCTEDSCGTGAFDEGPHGGEFWLWFGTVGTGLEREQNVWQDIDVPVGATTLSYWLKTNIFGEVHRGELQVLVDQQMLERYDLPPHHKIDYRLQTVDVSEFADGRTHELRFRGLSDSGLGGVGWQMDDIAITGCSLAVVVGKTVVGRGGELPFEVQIHHHRLKTVTVPVLAALIDSRNRVVAEYASRELTMPYRHRVQRDFQIQIPDDARRGEYTLKVCVSEMSGDQSLCTSAPVEVAAFERL